MNVMDWYFILLIILGCIFVVCFTFSLFIIQVSGKRRFNGNPRLKYFTADNFENLQSKPISFRSNKGQLIHGFIYQSSIIEEYKGLIIFNHGIGAGHYAYETEINFFAKNGYIVVGYDYTGCVLSEGEHYQGLSQPLYDFKACLDYVDSVPELKKYNKIIIGHSWGGFVSANVFNFNYKIYRVVSLSGFNSPIAIMCELVKPLHILYPFLYLANMIKFGSIGAFTSKKSLSKAICPVLLVHGLDDKFVSYQNNLGKFTDLYSKKKYIKILTIANRGHGVYLSNEAEEYEQYVFKTISGLNKKLKKNPEAVDEVEEFYKHINYSKITEEDAKLMQEILDFIK